MNANSIKITSSKEVITSLFFTGEADAYCLIKCEGETVRTPVEKGTPNPKWNTTAIFYRAKPEQPIVIEVSWPWEHQLL